jgi:hypothetical protein
VTLETKALQRADQPRLWEAARTVPTWRAAVSVWWTMRHLKRLAAKGVPRCQGCRSCAGNLGPCQCAPQDGHCLKCRHHVCPKVVD